MIKRCAEDADERSGNSYRGGKPQIRIQGRREIAARGGGNNDERAHEKRAYKLDARRDREGEDKQKKQFIL